METVKRQYKSETYYKDITEVKYTPLYCYENQYLLHKRGEVKRIKIFGFTISTKVYDEDVYLYNGYEEPVSEILSWGNRCIKDGLVYRKAKVVVDSKINSESFLFDDDNEAKKFVKNLIDNCRAVGNNLV